VSITYAHYHCDVPSELVQNVRKLKKTNTKHTRRGEEKQRLRKKQKRNKDGSKVK